MSERIIREVSFPTKSIPQGSLEDIRSKHLTRTALFSEAKIRSLFHIDRDKEEIMTVQVDSDDQLLSLGMLLGDRGLERWEVHLSGNAIINLIEKKERT